jgi:hypothetical protein
MEDAELLNSILEQYGDATTFEARKTSQAEKNVFKRLDADWQKSAVNKYIKSKGIESGCFQVIDEDTQPFRFKALSPELRNNVYAHYAQDYGISTHARHYTSSFHPEKLRTSFHELVFADKQIHDE